MKIVLESLLTLRAHFMQKVALSSPNANSPKHSGNDSLRWKNIDEYSGTSDSLQEDLSPRKFQQALRSPIISGTISLPLTLSHCFVHNCFSI